MLLIDKLLHSQKEILKTKFSHWSFEMFLMNPYIVLTNELARKFCIMNENGKDQVVKDKKQK